MIGLNDQRLPFEKALSLFFLISFVGLGCFSHRVDSDEESKNNVQQKNKESRDHPLYIHEGSRSVASICEERAAEDPSMIKVRSRYIANLQGGKAIIKDQCIRDPKDPQVLRDALSNETCPMDLCGVYDTYRRGPLWVALYLATLNIAFREAKVLIHSKQGETHENQNSYVDLGGENSKTHSIKNGLFTMNEHREVHRQQAKFDLGPNTHCVTALKIYRDQRYHDRADQLDLDRPKISLTAQPSSGELWAEHRQSNRGGFEVLIIERRLSQDRGSGEVLEREVLCHNDEGPIDPLKGYFNFSFREIDRDTARVFAKPR
jgi:hypothetical protein